MSAHGRRSVSAYRGWETRRERDEAVTASVAPELLPLWGRVGAAIHGTPQARLEAFEEYVDEHPGEQWEAIQGAADEQLDALIEAHTICRARRRVA
jgi:hypothetical protein